MSYEKAMKHSRNVRKLKKQANMYMGFDTGSGRWPSARGTPLGACMMHIRDWFKWRHDGDAAERKLTRECIREQIAEARGLLAQAKATEVAPRLP